jgi:hypothetical protein
LQIFASSAQGEMLALLLYLNDNCGDFSLT